VGSKFYMVFPLCTGGELYEHIIKRGHFTEVDAADLTRQIVGGLHALHEHDILHLDIKPENILFEVRRALFTRLCLCACPKGSFSCVRSYLAVIYCSNFAKGAVVLHVLLQIVVTATIGGSFCASNAVDCCILHFIFCAALDNVQPPPQLYV
jgi:serine/threonine protein kinase